ncbi:MAG: site-specific DNA-methyltransferase [Bacteroidota bacterium]
MTTPREHTPHETPNIADEQRAKLKQLFPEAFTEKNIDWEKLKATLGEVTETSPERYSFTWAGKRDAIRLLQTPSRATLVPVKDESEKFDTTQNIFIEGDNLEALKLLYKAYFNKVKMIYIDPPYNTGKDFIYPDNYTDPLDTYLKLTNQKDSEGNILTSNPETSGRYHSAWLSMMYPRLFLARQLLRDDGVIFVSIEDTEIVNLKLLLNEIFGEENFVGTLHWKRKKQPSFLHGHIAPVMEYVVVYSKELSKLEKLSIEKRSDFNTRVDNSPNDFSERLIGKGIRVKLPSDIKIIKKGVYKNKTMTTEYLTDVEIKDGRTIKDIRVKARFRNTQQQIDLFVEKDALFITKNYGLRRDLLPEELEKRKAITDLLTDWGDNQESDEELGELFPEGKPFEYPKPTKLIYNLIKCNETEEEIVLDFFAGSATSADAVLQINKEDNGNRKFILVQLPEPCGETSEAYKAGYKTIADIGKERIRRVIKNLEKEKEGKLDLKTRETPEDLGFKVFKLAESNYKVWNPDDAADPATFVKQAELFTDSLKDGWKAENVIYEIAIKEGYTLNSNIEQIKGKHQAEISKVTDNDKGQSFYITLEDKVTLERLKGLALTKDDLFICRDVALDDETAANLALQCRLKTI